MASVDSSEGPPPSSRSSAKPRDEDVVSILVATDNHLGYLEKDPIRGNDSFVTFEEILREAQARKVDFLLLGGDLFHDNKPSRRTLVRTMELMRKYCFGDSEIKIKIVSDQSLNFASKRVNYEDPNFNIQTPIFSIHGNHDDPSGDGSYAALDILSTCNFVNYFGKNTELDRVEVRPILLTKGTTKLAIYGLGNIRDERLNRVFSQKKVHFLRPDDENPDSWFSVFVLHQNRVAHSPKNCIHETMLPNWLNLVIWGHEHECNITPMETPAGNFRITQPGSSIATSLSEFEAKPKHVGLLQITGTKYRLRPIPLRTVRPFVIDEIVLSSLEELANPPKNKKFDDFISDILEEKVEQMIAESAAAEEAAQAELHSQSSRPPQPFVPRLPLVRLKVEYSGFNTINPQRFGHKFVTKIANPGDVLLFYRKKTTSLFGSRPALRSAAEAEVLARATRIPEPMDETNMDELISTYLGQEIQTPHILVDRDFQEALHNFVEKEENDAFLSLVTGSVKGMENYLKEQRDDQDNPIVTGSEDPRMVLEIMAERTMTLKAQRAVEAEDAANAAKTSRVKSEQADDGDAMAMDVDVATDSTAPPSNFKTPVKPGVKKAAAKPRQTTLKKTTAAAPAAPSSAPPNSTKSRARIVDEEEEAAPEDEDVAKGRRAPPLQIRKGGSGFLDDEDDDEELNNLLVTPKSTPKPAKASASVKVETPRSPLKRPTAPPAAAAAPAPAASSASQSKKRKAAAISDDIDEDAEYQEPPPAKRAKLTAAAASASASIKRSPSKASSTSAGPVSIDLTEDDLDDRPVAAALNMAAASARNWGSRKK